MIAIIFFSFLTLIGAAFSIYLWQRTPSGTPDNRNLPPRGFEGLFDGPDQVPLVEDRQLATQATRRELLELARGGDLNVLNKAHSTRDPGLYAEVLDALVESTSERQEDFAALVSHVSRSNQLRANKQLARRLLETWKGSPDRRSTTEMIHIAALSDDAEIYEEAVEAALEFWRPGKLPQFSAEELVELFVSQYWLLAPEARRGGVGFALKRRLLGVRRELATATRAR